MNLKWITIGLFLITSILSSGNCVGDEDISDDNPESSLEENENESGWFFYILYDYNL